MVRDAMEMALVISAIRILAVQMHCNDPMGTSLIPVIVMTICRKSPVCGWFIGGVEGVMTMVETKN